MRPLNDLQKYLVEEFVGEYQDRRMSRRELIARVLGITGGVAATATLLLAMGCGPQPAPTSTPAPKPVAVPTSPPQPATPTTQPTAAAAVKPAVSPTSPQPPAATPPTQPTAAGAKPAASPPGRSPLSVAPDDPTIEMAEVSFPGDGADIKAYLARPKGAGPFAAVLVCHENRGLVDHIKDVTQRFAKAGYVGLAVDLLSRQGGTRCCEPKPGARTAFGQS